MDDLLNLEGLNREQLAGLAFDASLKEVIRKIKAGEATAADLTFALNAAKHLNIGQVPSATNGAGQLKQAITEGLPFPDAGMAH
ncbi:MAG: hypothetical protein ACK4K3_07395 [Aquabacterium sp.]